jgi:hypothetical protein
MFNFKGNAILVVLLLLLRTLEITLYTHLNVGIWIIMRVALGNIL